MTEMQAKVNDAKDDNETSEKCPHTVPLKGIFSKREAKLTMQDATAQE